MPRNVLPNYLLLFYTNNSLLLKRDKPLCFLTCFFFLKLLRKLYNSENKFGFKEKLFCAHCVLDYPSQCFPRKLEELEKDISGKNFRFMRTKVVNRKNSGGFWGGGILKP